MSKGCLKYFMVSPKCDREQLLAIAEQCFQNTFDIEGTIFKISDVADMNIRRLSGKSAIITLKSKENNEDWDLLYKNYCKYEGRDIEKGVYLYQYITDLDVYLKGVNTLVNAIRQAIPDIQITLRNAIDN